ncbi:hypothetical protein KKF25_01640, partial [Patescibacteria group bacterium]|nr:hypothetical protein [Patescibacteria group bacterium]
MGTPRKTKFRQEAEAPTIGEKIRLFEIGKETGLSLSLERLPALLEEVKGLFLPLVQSFDKPLFPGGQAVVMDCPPPKAFQKARAMRLYSGKFISLWLERSGSWLVELNELKNDERYQRIDSQQLSKIIRQECGYLLTQSLGWKAEGLLAEIPSVIKIALYHLLVSCFLSQIFEKAQEILEERENRLRVAREWISLLGEFVQSLDPLVSQNKRVKMKTYSIFSENEHGASRYSDSYLCPEALKPFWEAIKARKQENLGYK